MQKKRYKVLVFTIEDSTFNISAPGILLAFSIFASEKLGQDVDYDLTFLFWGSDLDSAATEDWDLIFVNLYPCPRSWLEIRKLVAGLEKQSQKLIGYGDPNREEVAINWSFPVVWRQDLEVQGRLFAQIFIPEFFS